MQRGGGLVAAASNALCRSRTITARSDAQSTANANSVGIEADHLTYCPEQLTPTVAHIGNLLDSHGVGQDVDEELLPVARQLSTIVGSSPASAATSIVNSRYLPLPADVVRRPGSPL